MISIAIDGPSSAGKSSLSKFIIQEFGFIHVDTGALYRAVALHVVRNGVKSFSSENVVPLLDGLEVKADYDSEGNQHVYLNGELVDSELRTEEVSMAASAVSAIPEVREFLLEPQREIAKNNNIVMDGRDVGTVILPNADIKFFLSATSEKRAQRRFLEYKKNGIETTYEKVLEDITQRDLNDSTRALSPLRQAEDAIAVDNSEMTEEETKEFIFNIIRSKLG